MLRVPTYISKSAIHGIGVFASDDIKADTLIWSFEPHFDQSYSEHEYASLSLDVQNFVKWYGYRYSKDGLYYLPGDNDRFVNHSLCANTYDADDGNVYALRDIAKDEEITTNYADFDAFWIAHDGVKDFASR